MICHKFSVNIKQTTTQMHVHYQQHCLLLVNISVRWIRILTVMLAGYNSSTCWLTVVAQTALH